MEDLKKRTVGVSSNFNPATGKYTIEEVRRGEMPRRRNFDSHEELVKAVEKANPGREVQVG